LETIGSIPPIGKRAFLEMIAGANGPVQTVETILLSDDLMQYEALLAGELEPAQADFTVLSLDKTDEEPALPAYLLPADDAEEQETRVYPRMQYGRVIFIIQRL